MMTPTTTEKNIVAENTGVDKNISIEKLLSI